MKILFWLLWTWDALVASMFVCFFVIGIGDGAVSSFNIVLRWGILGSLAAILGEVGTSFAPLVCSLAHSIGFAGASLTGAQAHFLIEPSHPH
jgi:hypothetical protein